MGEDRFRLIESLRLVTGEQALDQFIGVEIDGLVGASVGWLGELRGESEPDQTPDSGRVGIGVDGAVEGRRRAPVGSGEQDPDAGLDPAEGGEEGGTVCGG